MFGVFDASVVDSDQRLDQAVADLGDFAQGEPALVELAVAEPLIAQVADQPLQARGRGVGEASGWRFRRRRRSSGWPPPWSAAWARGSGKRSPRPARRRDCAVAPVGLVVEELDQGRAVVLLDQVDDRLGQVVLPAQVDPVLDVADDDQRAHGRCELGVPAGRADLVFHEVVGLEHLADVVKIGSDANQQGIGADALGRRLGDGADGDRVVMGAGSAADQLLEQRDACCRPARAG